MANAQMRFLHCGAAIAVAALLAVAAEPALAGRCQYDNGTDDGPCTVYINRSYNTIALRCANWGQASRGDVALDNGDSFTCRGDGGTTTFSYNAKWWFWHVRGDGKRNAYPPHCPGKRAWFYFNNVTGGVGVSSECK